MKSRNELAHDYLCALLANSLVDWRYAPDDIRKWAFDEADAFLAACGENPQAATWVLENNEGLFSINWYPPENSIRAILAGRDRVKLAVRVVEDSE